ncbi:MAG: patatin-like phospholipase family protein [Chloroflexota bacterium]
MDRPIFSDRVPSQYRRAIYSSLLCAFSALILIAGCAHYPVNEPLKAYDPHGGYRGKNVRVPGKSDDLLLFVTFSGGGTRAAALSYGVLEQLARTEVVVEGKKRHLLDEVDVISAVSGGSFTAAYYGLFGERIFEDFESRFLRKNVQGALAARIFLNPVNWMRLLSPFFDRSDLAAEYYDEHIFQRGTFGDMVARKGPMVIVNATDMTYGTRVGFTQDMFDPICSDLGLFPVARAVAASSAVPVLMTPITVRNYAGSCNYRLPTAIERVLKEDNISERQFYLSNNIGPFLDSEKKPFLHLLDGGVSDNLGLRAILDRIVFSGDYWASIRDTHHRNVHKIVFILVNAETQPDTSWDRVESPPAFAAMLESYSTIAIERYNAETVALLKESLKQWTEQVRTGRCPEGRVSMEPGSCGDIRFYVIEVKFDALKNEDESLYLKRLPTSFNLSSEQVDRLREAAHRILSESKEFRGLVEDLR